jgi:L-amino acid N-acyltransferase
MEQTGSILESVAFRLATIRDAPEIGNILNYYISNTNNSWRYEILSEEYYNKWVNIHQTDRRPIFVAEYEGLIVGYSSLSDFRAGEGYWPCAENSIYIRPGYTGQGIGRQLMRLIIDQGRTAGLKAIIASIDGENKSSIKFHELFGFYICGTLKNIGWKNNTWRTCIFMQLDLHQPDDATE